MNSELELMGTLRGENAERSPSDSEIEGTALHQTPPSASHLSEFCPRFRAAMDMIGRRWAGVILRVLLSGPHRFNEILAAIPGISDRLLTERLRELEAEGVVTRRVLCGPPVRVEYELTPKGQELETVICAVSAWAEKWLPLPQE